MNATQVSREGKPIIKKKKKEQADKIFPNNIIWYNNYKHEQRKPKCDFGCIEFPSKFYFYWKSGACHYILNEFLGKK